jgi:serine O-acetyltransferase
MFETIREDFRHKREWLDLPPTLRSALYLCVTDGGMPQLLYRLMRYCETHGMEPLAMVVYRLNAICSHTVIGRKAELGPGLVIVHSLGIMVNGAVRAGKNLVLEHGVTLGGEKGRCPVLGDNVFIGAGAKVLGPVKIGSDVKIGANAVVTKDIPDGATAVGVPARVVRVYGERVSSATAEATASDTEHLA